MGLFFGGTPVAPDVDLLMKEFGVPEKGTVIPYAEIEKVLELKWGDTRFKSVTNAWRKRLEADNNLLLDAVRGEGFKVLTEGGRVRHCGALFASGIKRIKVGARRALTTDRKQLTTSEVLQLDHSQKVAALMLRESAQEAPTLLESGEEKS